MFENTFSFGYMKPIFERHFLRRHALRYDETLRIGEDYILLASALAKGGRCVVEPSVGYSYHVRAGSISRVLELHHVEAMLAADAAFVRDHALDAARTGRAGAANPQPRGGGGVPVAGPASEGRGAAEGGRRGAPRPGRRSGISACRSRPGCGGVARSVQRAGIRSIGLAIGEQNSELGGGLDLNTGMMTR